METQLDKKYLKLDDIECYIIAFHLSNYVWDLVLNGNGLLRKQSDLNMLSQLIQFLQTLQKDSVGILKKIK
ncbi:MAG TPA: hypothetical protein VIJ75_04720 [Hanamia sp.]